MIISISRFLGHAVLKFSDSVRATQRINSVTHVFEGWLPARLLTPIGAVPPKAA